jgi:hypothetical protein
MHRSHHFCHFLNASWKLCSAPPAILPRTPQLCQNGGLSDDSHVSGKIFSGEKGSERWRIVNSFATKVWSKVFKNFQTVAVKVTIST